MTMKKQKTSACTPKLFQYTILGQPLSLARVHDDGPRVWDTYKQSRFNYMQTVKNQHKSQQIIEGPIHLEATFFMRPTIGDPLRNKNGSKLSMLSLFSFMFHAFEGIVYKKDCIISELKLKKIYDKKPRTEIKIMRA